ncbi:hypothetical protein HDU77_007793 [Chytriomyces hyalinus]|nr:hypothetical protein HDU77_007793 [Chytriomyces hyalinus]
MDPQSNRPALPPMPTPSSLGHRLTSAASDYYRSQSLVPSDFMPDNKQPASSILGAISNNPDSNIVAQLCGFDPLDLLDTVDFPNDRYERLLRISKEARQLAMRHEEIPLSQADDDFIEPVPTILTADISRPITTTSTGAASNSSHESSLLNAVLEPTTKFLLDTKEGIRVEQITAEAASEALTEAKLKERQVLKEQLSRSAASIVIQSLFRGFLIRRKYIAVKYHRLTIKSHDTESKKVINGLPGVVDLTIQERLIERFKRFSIIFESQMNFLPDFPYFCAAKIQATFRMAMLKRKWATLQALTVEEKAGVIGTETKNAIIHYAQRANYKVSTYVKAVVRIQKFWRSYSSKKIFKFYRNLIKFRESGNPAMLLKYVNPKESKLIDAASSTHVRFRLGGTSFPPTIYYKIFVHCKLVDMNSFSPRDYTKLKQKMPRELFLKGPREVDVNADGWYQRFENNGWRPIVQRNWREEQMDEVVCKTAQKVVPFHHLKLKRRQQVERLKKLKKLEWMTKLYEEGRKLGHSDPILQTVEKDEKVLFSNEQELLDAMATLESEVEHEFLTKWSEALDFDSYCDNWLELSTTGKSEDFKSLKAALADAPFKNPNSHDIKLAHDFAAAPPSQAHDDKSDVLAEINLFKKLAADHLSGASDEHSGVVTEESESGRKPRPWSGRSNKSLENLFLTDYRTDEI